MKKIISIILLSFLLFSVTGCNKEIGSEEISKSISDITSDSDGNVIIKLIDGRSFSLGNLKGEKGEKGDKGEQGEQGLKGLSGKNGKDGTNGVDGVNGSSISDYVKDVVIEDGIVTVKYGDGTEETLGRLQKIGEHKLTIKKVLYDSSMVNIIETQTETVYLDKNELYTIGFHPVTVSGNDQYDLFVMSDGYPRYFNCSDYQSLTDDYMDYVGGDESNVICMYRTSMKDKYFVIKMGTTDISYTLTYKQEDNVYPYM